MTPRPYRLGRRAEGVRGTRTAILEAARRLMADEGFLDLSVERVAASADVSRATVYHHFGSKLGVVEALMTRVEEEGGFERLLEARQVPEAGGALAAFLRALPAFWLAAEPVFRNLYALAAVDSEVRRMVRRKDHARRGVVADLVQRLESEGRLAQGLSPARARALLMAVTEFGTTAVLAREGLSAEEAGAMLVALADRALTGLESPRGSP